MPGTFPFHTVSVAIERPAQQVYDFTSRPENLSLWASGLGQSIKHIDGNWVAQTPAGKVRIAFCQLNTLGVLDHVVTLESGEHIAVPMRVVPNGDGSLLMLSIFRLPEVSDDQFAADIAWVEGDFNTLKLLLESGTAA